MGAEFEVAVPLAHRASFVKARTAFCHDDMATARPLFEAIARALPYNVEIRLYAACARARLAESLSEREREELERLAREALGARQALALPLCILAQAAFRRGELRVARRLFRRATEADPVLVDARRGLRRVEQRLRHGRGHDNAFFAATARFAVAFALVMVGIAAIVVQTAS